MTRVIADISVSLDGYVTGPDVGPQLGLGAGGEALHRWAIESQDSVDRELLRIGTEQSGAVIMGRTLFDFVDGPTGWSEELGYGAEEVGTPPFFVVTSSVPEHVRLGHDFTFVTGGPAAAVEQARAAAGDKDVVVMGGAQVIRGCLEEGLLDGLRLHLAPETYGAGTPLFDGITRHSLRQVEVQVSPYAVHVTYDVLR